MIQEEIKKGNINSRLDNCVSSLDIQAREDKKQQEIIRLMPEIKKRSALVSENESSFEAGIFCRGFVEGAEWRIDSVWHDMNEEPKKEEMLLLHGNGRTISILWNGDMKWKGMDKFFHADTWAYVSDLLPIKEE